MRSCILKKGRCKMKFWQALILTVVVHFAALAWFSVAVWLVFKFVKEILNLGV